MRTETYDGMACDDCVQMLANGDVNPEVTPEQEAAIAEGTVGYALSAPSDFEPTFSCRPCACCNSRLAGDRTPVTRFASAVAS